MTLPSRGLRSPFYQYDESGGGDVPPPHPFGFGYEFQPERSGPDWERPELGLFSRWWSTVLAVFTKPAETFQNMRVHGGIGAPLVFGLIGGTIGSVGATLYQTVFEGLGMGAQLSGGVSEDQLSVLALQSGMGFVCGICLAPVFIAIGLFVMSGITHLMLMLLGGAQQGFEATFRCHSYVSGSLGLLNIIPVCGGCVYFVWYIIVMATALSQVHEISLGKAYAAILIPIILCCGLGLAAVALIVGAVAASI